MSNDTNVFNYKNVDIRLKNQMLPDLVMEKLMDWIMDGSIVMGEKLNTEQLASRLGVSRMPVREALKNMEKKGIIESIPYVGNRVVRLAKSDIYQIYLLRLSLEPVAAFYACQNIKDDDIAVLEEIQNRLTIVINEYVPDPKKIYLINKEFHFSLYKFSSLNRMCTIITSLWDNLSFYKLIYGMNYATDKAQGHKMLQEHGNYINKLKDRDYEGIKGAFENSLRKHMIEVPDNLARYLNSD